MTKASQQNKNKKSQLIRALLVLLSFSMFSIAAVLSMYTYMRNDQDIRQAKSGISHSGTDNQTVTLTSTLDLIKTAQDSDKTTLSQATTSKSNNTLGATTTKTSSTYQKTSSTSTTTSQPAPTPKSPSNGSCPATTQNCIPCNVDELYCRFETGASTGFKGWSCQNNNPGNIRHLPFRVNLITAYGGAAPCGVRYDSRGGTYMIFSTYSQGYGALKAYIKAINAGAHSSYTGCGNCTLEFFFSKYAPGDPNYDNYVGSRLGVDPTTTTLSWVVNNKLDAFVLAIQTHEGWFVY